MELNIDFRGFEIVYELRLLRGLFTTLESKLAEAQESALKELELDYDLSDDEGRSLYYSTLGGFESHHEVEAQVLRTAYAVRLYMLFEQHLKGLCGTIKRDQGLNLSYSDLNGTPVERCKIFLSKYVGVLNANDQIWTRLADFQLVRDVLVHGGNSPTKGPRGVEIRKLIARNIGVREGGGFEEGLVLSSAFLARAHEDVTSFFKAIFASLGWKSFADSESRNRDN